MDGILTKYKVSDKYVSWLSWLIIFVIIIIAYVRFPLSSITVGDENYYVGEVTYLSQYGLYHALSQGTSIVLSVLIYLLSKLLFVDFLSGARILSVVFYLIASFLFLKCTRRFPALDHAGRHLALVCFGIACSGWIWKCLADVISVSFLLGVYYLLSGVGSRKRLIQAGALLMVSFAVKPVVMLAIPGFVLFVLLKGRKNNLISPHIRIANTLIFILAFAVCFTIYHTPGYLTYHKLMLEVKDHHYEGVKRIDNSNSWLEKNIYFEVYNVHNRPNKWGVTWEEVDSFKQQHPDIRLNLGYSDFIKLHFGIWCRNISSKLLLYLPYGIQSTFFFSKWTYINHFVKNILIIKALTLLLIAAVYWRERRFVADNLLLLMPPFMYFFLLSLYTIPQLEDNWLIFCIPFLCLPVVKFLLRYVNALLLLGLQLLFVL